MFPVLAFASLAFSAVGVMSQIKAAQDARQAERDNAKLIEKENVEQARRMESENSATESEARARAAASGITMDGTTGEYLTEMERENDRQEKWLRQSGKSRSDLANDRGDAAFSSGLAGAAGTLAGASGSAYKWFG